MKAITLILLEVCAAYLIIAPKGVGGKRNINDRLLCIPQRM